MAPVTYYYFFSMIALLGISTWLINLIYMRLKSRTIFGRSYKAGTAVYERVMKIASGRNIFITVAIILLAFVNLVWSIITVLRVDTQDARLLLVAAPIVTLVAWVAMMIKMRKEYGPSRKVSRKKDKDEDSWF